MPWAGGVRAEVGAGRRTGGGFGERVRSHDGSSPTRPPGAWAAAQATDAGSARAFRLGQDVVHRAFGEGVVTGVEPGGVIVVRFAGDGSERKLMAELAPVTGR